MKLAPNSTAANKNHFPVGITGTIVPTDIGEMILLAVPAKAFRTIRHTFRPASQAKQGEFMNPGSSISLNSKAWRDLYKAALFEVDKTRLPDRIAQAEEALALRARELFHVAGDNIEEGEALDDAMYALHALRSTSQINHRLNAARGAVA
jgi:hypothetical protein